MKRTPLRSVHYLSIGAIALSLLNCQGAEELSNKEPVISEAEITRPVEIKVTQIEESKPVDADEALLATAQAPVIPDPQAAHGDPYYQDIFADDDLGGVPPWRANYIGSYGLMPTRFQDKGPFLYSFDVSPDADILQDDDTSLEDVPFIEDDDF